MKILMIIPSRGFNYHEVNKKSEKMKILVIILSKGLNLE